jgi:hypothetical protein
MKFASKKGEQRRYIKGMRNDDRRSKKIWTRARVGVRPDGTHDGCLMAPFSVLLQLWAAGFVVCLSCLVLARWAYDMVSTA